MPTHEDFSRTHAVKTSSHRAFGVVFAVAFAILGLWPLVSHGGVRMWAVVVAGVFLLAAIAAPSLLALPNSLWQRVGAMLHRIVSPVILAFMFYGVVTPIGMLKRALSRDDFRWRRGGEASTYWIPREPRGPKPESLKHQF